jgi:hypothetical protein
MNIDYLENIIDEINRNTIDEAKNIPFNEFLIEARSSEIYPICLSTIELPIFNYNTKQFEMSAVNQDSTSFSYTISFKSRGILQEYVVVLIYGIGFSILDLSFAKVNFNVIADISIETDIENILLAEVMNMFLHN